MAPAPVALSTSSVELKLVVMATVAPVRFVLSGSVTVIAEESVTGAASSVYEAVGATVSAGGSLTGVMLIVELAGVELSVPSVTTQTTVRLAADGLSELLKYVTVRRTLW